MWELDCEESWAPRNWSFWTVVLEKTLESPMDCKEIQPVHPKGNQSWIFTGRTHAEAETLVLWPPDAKSWFIGKDPEAGEDTSQEEKGRTEDEMVWWYHHSMDMSLSKLQEMMMYREAWRVASSGVTKSQTWLSSWTTHAWPCLNSLRYISHNIRIEGVTSNLNIFGNLLPPRTRKYKIEFGALARERGLEVMMGWPDHTFSLD